MWWLMLEGKFAIAPIAEPKNVLDIGTGTGIWAIRTFTMRLSVCIKTQLLFFRSFSIAQPHLQGSS